MPADNSQDKSNKRRNSSDYRGIAFFLLVACYPIHPNFDKLELLIKDYCTKRWKLRSGLLPGQGIQLEWKPKNSESLNEEEK